MTFWEKLTGGSDYDKYIKRLYDNPAHLIDVEFHNNSVQSKTLWVEPACEEIELDPLTEYKVVTHDKFLRFEFADEPFITLYLQYSFGFILYKRPYSEQIENPFVWELVIDSSDIN